MEHLDFTAFRPIGDIIQDLKKPVALKHIKKLTKGGRDIPYMSWNNAVKYLDFYANGWNYELRHLDEIGGKLIITVRLTIPAKEGLFYREATGQEDAEMDAYGDSSSNAEAQALKRAAAKFGLGLYLYGLDPKETAKLLSGQQVEVKTPPPIRPTSTLDPPKPPETPVTLPEAAKAPQTANTAPETTNQSYNSPIFDGNPIARSSTDLVTAKQLGMMRAVCRELGIDADEECQAVLNCKTDELSKAAANAFIKYLQTPAEIEKAETVSGTMEFETGDGVTRAQLETLELLAKRLKGNKSMIDIVQEYTDGRVELFEDMLASEADKAIKGLSDALRVQATAKK